jgi:hypothetical protein
MAKKINSNDRRKLLEAHGRGLSNSEIKGLFGISDDRTLRRHLQLAEQEQEARAVKTEVLKEALRDHLAEVRQVIENLKGGIRIEPVNVHLTMASFVTTSRLFGSLKSHLPFPSLWRDYNQWETKYKSYVASCQELQKEIQKRATTQMKLDFAPDTSNFSHFTSGLRDWIFALVRDKLEGLVRDKPEGNDVKEVEFNWQDLKISVKGSVLEGKQMSVERRELLEIINQSEINTEFYEKGCQALINSCLSSEIVINLSTLLADLHNLEPKILNSLEEILLRRDYILYTCNLCPGKSRLLR